MTTRKIKQRSPADGTECSMPLTHPFYALLRHQSLFLNKYIYFRRPIETTVRLTGLVG